MADTTTKIIRQNWAINGGTNAKGLYALSIVNLDDVFGTSAGLNLSASATIKAISSDDLSPIEFVFNMNPKSMSLEEPAAVTIVPTQNQGQFIEHQGQIYKNVVITGTTGLRPNRTKPGGIIPVFNVLNPFFDPALDSDTGLPIGERTGYDDLLALRNLFRKYWDKKADPASAHKTVMVWQNGKEGEYYVVEPMSFRSSRDASSPLTYMYDINLRTIEKLDITKNALTKDGYNKKNGLDRFFQRINDARKTLANAFGLIQALISSTTAIGQNAINAVMAPVNDILQGLTSIVVAGTRIFSIPKSVISTVATNAIELAGAIDSLANNAYTTLGVSTQLSGISNAYKTIGRVCHQLATEDGLSQQSYTSVVSGKAAAYGKNALLGAPPTGGSLTNLSNSPTNNRTGTTQIHGGEDIKGVTLRLLGDASRYKEIIILNNLKQPYISPAGDGVSVLRPGDAILFPQSGPTTDSAISPNTQKFKNVALANDYLGTDIRLVANKSAGGEVIYDIAENLSGDLDSIFGKQNMEQAVLIKFGTEQGGLATHPQFGIRFPLGTKIIIRSIISFQLRARATLLSDSRIVSVGDVKIFASGNVLQITAFASVRGVNTPLLFNTDVTV